MKYFVGKYCINGMTVLDIGSRWSNKVNKWSYRELFENNFDYTGMDIEAGINVDIVGFSEIKDRYDVVISGQTMEHVNRPWEWMKSLVPYFTKYICIIAPHTWKEHRYPIDTYRYFPDGMRDLFEYSGIVEIEIIKDIYDTMGIGKH